MATLQEMLLAPAIRPTVVADCEDLVTNQVAELSGVTGAAIKLAYNTIRGRASKQVKAALPALGPLIQKYA